MTQDSRQAEDDHLMNFLAPWVIADDPQDRADFLAALRAALAQPASVPTTGWTGNPDADLALILLDRLDDSGDGNATRIDQLEGLVRKLAASPQAPQPEAQPRWISVEECLPTINTEVLVAFDGMSLAATGQYTGKPHDRDRQGWCYPAENSGTCDDGSDPKVTHWMPLPDAPSAQAEHTQHCASRGGTGAECDCEAQAEPTACPHTGQCHPGFCQCSDAKQAEQGGDHV